MTGQVDPNEVRFAIQFFKEALVKASKGYSPTPPDQARAAVRVALVGTIRLISAIYPDEPSLPLPLNQLLYDLDGLDHGTVAAFFRPTKVSHRPRTALSDDLFRAIVAAAMTLLMDGTTVDGAKVSRDEAAREVARRLSKMGGKHSSGKSITGPQISKWRDKMMTERAAENRGVARYQHTLQLVGGMPSHEAVALILDSLTTLSPANFPKKPPA